MVREARKIAQEYPEIELWETNVDAMAMWLVKNPQKYGVLVSSNMFGDIISDLCAQLVGGLGFAASGNIGDKLAVFEPTHGSAPKYAGQYKVNPIAMLITTKLMLDYLGETEKADRLMDAIAKIIKEGKVRTYDMGGTSSTLDMARAIAEKFIKKESHDEIIKRKELQDKLSYKKKNFWKISSEKEREHAFVFADEYCTFIDEARTERLSVELTEQILKTYNFLPLTSDSSKKTPGFYRINRDKNIAIFRAGKKDISEGCNFIVAHIDVPRVDLKQVPLSEDGTTQLGIMLTHYYGGIRKYQWMAIPLAL